MSDTLHRKPTLQELALGFGQVAKEQGLDVYVVLCGEANPSGSFERISMIDGDAVKLLHAIASFVREKVPAHLQARFFDLLVNMEPAVEVGQQANDAPEPPKGWVH
jgi:hypothetical protein